MPLKAAVVDQGGAIAPPYFLLNLEKFPMENLKMKPASEPVSHHCGHLEKSADEPRPAVEEAEDLMSYETETTLNINSSSCPYYVSVSDRIRDPTVFYPENVYSVWEIDQRYEDARAVYVGELTKKQSGILQREFHKLYKGPYVVGFSWDETYPPEDLESRVRLRNYARLSDEQKKALDLAFHLANSIRTEDGCESKNIKSNGKNTNKSSLQPTLKSKSETKQTRNRTSKYEVFVQAHLDQLTESVLERSKNWSGVKWEKGVNFRMV